MSGEVDEQHARTLLLAVFYEGPWERLVGWLLKIDRATLELKAEIRAGGVRERFADFCDGRNNAWRRRYVERGVDPPARWKRRGREAVSDA